jgi:hypothetical protein
VVRAKEDGARDEALDLLWIGRAFGQVVQLEIVCPCPLGRVEARSRNDVGEQRERRRDVLPQDGKRHGARVHGCRRRERRAERIDGPRKFDGSTSSCPFVEHVGGLECQPGFSLGIAR